MKKFSIRIYFSGKGYVARAETVSEHYGETREEAMAKALLRVASTPMLEGMIVRKATALVLRYDGPDPSKRQAARAKTRP